MLILAAIEVKRMYRMTVEQILFPLNHLTTSHTLGIAKYVGNSDARIESSDAWEYFLPS